MWAVTEWSMSRPVPNDGVDAASSRREEALALVEAADVAGFAAAHYSGGLYWPLATVARGHGGGMGDGRWQRVTKWPMPGSGVRGREVGGVLVVYG